MDTSEGPIVTELVEAKSGMAISQNRKRSRYTGNPPGSLLQSIPRWLAGVVRWPSRSIKTSEVIFFNSQLSLMLEIGTPLNIALKTIEHQTKSAAFKEVIQALRQDIEEGCQLSDAMDRHPRVFNQVFISMIKSGESGGFLRKILDRIVEMQEKRQALTTQLRATLTYPAILCILGLVVIVFVLVGVLPMFTSFFKGKESILPLTTRSLMILSDSLREYWWIYLLASAGLALSLKFCKESERSRRFIDRFYVSGPIVSRLANKVYTCQLLRILGHLMESQVPLFEALQVTRGTIRNRFFRNFIVQIMDHVQKGGRFSQPFASYPYILDSVKQMVTTAEEAGNLPKVMLRLAEFYDNEVDRELKILASMLEPAALIVLGGAVGLIVSSVILPLFRLAHAVH